MDMCPIMSGEGGRAECDPACGFGMQEPGGAGRTCALAAVAEAVRSGSPGLAREVRRLAAQGCQEARP